jgi:hypothetical protein
MGVAWTCCVILPAGRGRAYEKVKKERQKIILKEYLQYSMYRTCKSMYNTYSPSKEKGAQAYTVSSVVPLICTFSNLL